MEDTSVALSKSSYFHLNLTVVSGHNLLVMDRGGTSDPYVKVYQGDRLQHRTSTLKKTLNPVWNDEVDIYLRNAFDPILFKVRTRKKMYSKENNCIHQVYDKDRVVSDDFMGMTRVNVSAYELGSVHKLEIDLDDGGDPFLTRYTLKND